MSVTKTADILVAGGGYVGLSTAVAIALQAPHLKIIVADAAPEAALENDERASAIAAAASRMLKVLGVWQGIEEHAQPINEMIVTDSKLQDVTRPVFLTFGESGSEPGEGETETGEPFAHMMPNRYLVGALRKRAADLGIRQIFNCGVEDFSREGPGVQAELQNGERVSAKLLVAADGVRSRMRESAGIKTVHWPYDQWGIVTTVAHERPHNGRAEEHFLPAGPFAILPLKGNRSSLVWTESERDAKRILAMDDFSFELELEKRFGHKLGEISVDGPKKGLSAGPDPGARIRGRPGCPGRRCGPWHSPISGQGLNLGFKDAAALAETTD